MNLFRYVEAVSPNFINVFLTKGLKIFSKIFKRFYMGNEIIDFPFRGSVITNMSAVSKLYLYILKIKLKREPF